MLRFSMNEVTTYRWSFDEDVQRYAAAGITALGVWRQKLSDYGEERGVALLKSAGMTVSNLMWAGGFTGSDGRTLRESISDAREAIRLAGAMRAQSLVVYSGARAGHTHAHARRLLHDALADLLPLAEEFNVVLAIEPMSAECAAEWTFLTSLDDALTVIDKANSPLVRLAFDTYHFGRSPGIVERVEALAPRIAVVHLGDGRAPRNREQDRTPLGEGDVPLAELVAALIRGGYDGYFDVELIGEAIESMPYEDLLDHSRRTFARLLESLPV